MLNLLGISALILGAVTFCGHLASGEDYQYPDTQQIEQQARARQKELDAYTLVTWESQGASCSDGWPSQSIGKRGACSHHGGVVSVYLGSNGQQLRCGAHFGPPTTKSEQLDDIKTYGELTCF